MILFAHHKLQINKGFTLVELLVVIAIIALLTTIGSISFHAIKIKARDGKRIADTKQIRTALDIYFSEKELFPKTTGIIILGQGNFTCLNRDGFLLECATEEAYIKYIPSAPTPPTDNKYTYSSVDGNNYQLSFTLEKVNKDLGNGVNCIATKENVVCAE